MMAPEQIEEIVRSGDLTPFKEYATRAASFLSHPCDDVVANPDVKKEIAILFATAHLSGDPRTYKMAKRVLTLLGGSFDCPDLVRFCGSPRGRVALEMMSSYNRKEKVVELYFFTLQNRIIHRHGLADLLKYKHAKGIRVTPILDSSCCGTCKRGKQTFAWGEIHKIPELPRHWGCRCSVMAWL